MITWTQAGAVERPTTVQIRVQRSFPGRVRAGAPVPTRSMSEEEIRDNLRFFTVGMNTPRARPCERLVLSGVGVASREGTPETLALARQWGVSGATLHVGTEDLDGLELGRLRGLVDALVVPMQPGPAGGGLMEGATALRRCREVGARVVATTTLTAHAVRELLPAARAIAAAAPYGAALSWPFPIAGNTSVHVPGLGAALQALHAVVPILEGAGVRVDLKGLPACYLGELRRLVRRSANRWYVDADHQKGDAILFYPDVVRFTKSDACRFCSLDGSCDGFFATYLRREGFPPLRAIGT